MPTWMLLTVIVGVAGIPYLLWTRYEARRHAKFAVAAAAADSLGDEVIPVSLHPEPNRASNKL